MGVLGGVIGRKICRKIDAAKTDKLFLGMIVVIMGICVYNLVRFLR